VLRLRDPRRFGAVLWAPGEVGAHPLLAHLGIEPLSPALNAERLHALTRGHRTAIKHFLMDGRRIVGVGNIYASEALWRARISPLAPAAGLTAARRRRLADALRDTVRHALRVGRGRYARSAEEGGAHLDAYGRAGEPCRRCGAAIVRVVQAGRSTFYCPRCQRR